MDSFLWTRAHCFRLVYAGNPDNKDEAAKAFVKGLCEFTGKECSPELVKDVWLHTKEIDCKEVLS